MKTEEQYEAFEAEFSAICEKHQIYPVATGRGQITLADMCAPQDPNLPEIQVVIHGTRTE